MRSTESVVVHTGESTVPAELPFGMEPQADGLKCVLDCKPMLMLLHMLRHMPSKSYSFQIFLHWKKDPVEKAIV